MYTLLEKKIGEIVSEDFRTAAVFTKHQLDYCCGGHRSLKEVCESRGIEPQPLIEELNAVRTAKAENQIDFLTWPLDLMTAYIQKTHHRYVRETSPILLNYLNTLCEVHGDRHPELLKIRRLFSECVQAMEDHMRKEETILFPYIDQIVQSKQQRETNALPPFGTIDHPIRQMEHEHEAEGERFRLIAELTNRYTPPSDACETYRVTYAMLQEFEQDLFKHIHLENNILFPRAIASEQFA